MKKCKIGENSEAHYYNDKDRCECGGSKRSIEKACCKQSKNWHSYVVLGWDSPSGSWVGYKCIKCKQTYGMDYGEYLAQLRKDNPHKQFYA